MKELQTSTFTRTTQGKIAQYRFFSEPVVWLEGTTDYPMFEPLLRTMNCKPLSAGGKEESLKLAQAMIADDLPYIVVVDGDYEILGRQRSYHRRALLLKRHSIENYCAEAVLIEIVCQRYSEGRTAGADVIGRFEELVEHLEEELKALVVLDIALTHVADRASKGVLSGSIERVLGQKAPPVFDRAEVERLATRKAKDVGPMATERAGTLLSRYTERKRFVDIVRGHWVFALIRWFVVGELERVGMKMNIDNRGLRVLLGGEMWREASSQDHRSLRRGLQRAVGEVRRMRVGRL